MLFGPHSSSHTFLSWSRAVHHSCEQSKPGSPPSVYQLCLCECRQGPCVSLKSGCPQCSGFHARLCSCCCSEVRKECLLPGTHIHRAPRPQHILGLPGRGHMGRDTQRTPFTAHTSCAPTGQHYRWATSTLRLLCTHQARTGQRALPGSGPTEDSQGRQTTLAYRSGSSRLHTTPASS